MIAASAPPCGRRRPRTTRPWTATASTWWPRWGRPLGVVSGRAPFVLVDTAALGQGSVRGRLAARGFAVRRGESFPGLGPTWIRIKVPRPEVADAFVAALASLR